MPTLNGGSGRARTNGLGIYEAAGVVEYMGWRVIDNAIDWFRLIDGKYQLIAPDRRGIIESRLLPGLRLASANQRVHDLRGVVAALEPT